MPLTADGAKTDSLGRDVQLPAAKEKTITGPFRPSRVCADQAFEQVIGPISHEHPSLISKTRLGLAGVALALAVAFMSLVAGAGSAQAQI
jgi:hypothetical protein